MAQTKTRSKRGRDHAMQTANAMTTYLGWTGRDAARANDLAENSAGYHIRRCREAKDAVEFGEACKAVDKRLMIGTYEIAFRLQEKLLDLVAQNLLDNREVGWNLEKALSALGKMRMWDQGTMLDENTNGKLLEGILERVMRETPEGSSFKLEVTKAQPAIEVVAREG